MNLQKPEIFYFNGGQTEMALYHGSKDGIKGDIRPDQSRMETDFGQGFYMGENQEQPKTLIATHHRPVFYKLKVNLHDLKCVKVSGTTWAMLVAYNRGKLEDFQDTPLYQKISRLTANCDMVIGQEAHTNNVRKRTRPTGESTTATTSRRRQGREKQDG